MEVNLRPRVDAFDPISTTFRKEFRPGWSDVDTHHICMAAGCFVFQFSSLWGSAEANKLQ